MTETDTPPPDEARPDEVQFSLHWQRRGDTGLTGELVARNVSSRTWRLTGKPGLVPIDAEGRDLDHVHTVTLEMRLPGYALVAPGATANASVGLGSWDGAPLSETVRIEWPGGRADVHTTGPQQPATAGEQTQTSSSWFVADEGAAT